MFFYEEIKELTPKELKKQWRELARKSTAKSNSAKVWSYITSYNAATNTYPVGDRIDAYLHIADLESRGLDQNNLRDTDPEVKKELYYRYIDLLMTVYAQIDGSIGEDIWSFNIDEYISGI